MSESKEHKENKEKKPIIVAATGASGMPILAQCLRLIQDSGKFSAYLIVTRGGRLTMEQEMGGCSEVLALADRIFDPEKIGAEPASGSFSAEGMLIVPCSMKTIAGIHAGYGENLVLRAADVTLKEGRPLVLSARESPLSPIHLRNLYELSMIPGVRIIPPMMTFYHHPETIADMVYHTAARLVEPFGIVAPRYRRWGGLSDGTV